MFTSKWGNGSVFTYIMALSEKRANQSFVKRLFNPIKKKYQPIIINKEKLKNNKKIRIAQKVSNDILSRQGSCMPSEFKTADHAKIKSKIEGIE